MPPRGARGTLASGTSAAVGQAPLRYTRYNIVFRLKYNIFEQLLIRTRKQTYLDFNPSDPNIWINKEIENKLVDVVNHTAKLKDGYLTFKNPVTKERELIHVRVIMSNYEDNKFLTQQEVLKIQSKFLTIVNL